MKKVTETRLRLDFWVKEKWEKIRRKLENQTQKKNLKESRIVRDFQKIGKPSLPPYFVTKKNLMKKKKKLNLLPSPSLVACEWLFLDFAWFEEHFLGGLSFLSKKMMSPIWTKWIFLVAFSSNWSLELLKNCEKFFSVLFLKKN